MSTGEPPAIPLRSSLVSSNNCVDTRPRNDSLFSSSLRGEEPVFPMVVTKITMVGSPCGTGATAYITHLVGQNDWSDCQTIQKLTVFHILMSNKVPLNLIFHSVMPHEYLGYIYSLLLFHIPWRVGVILFMKQQFTPAAFFKKPAVHIIGSVNIDHLYDCAHLTSEGKCVIAEDYDKQIGGKGLNQAYALFQVSSFLARSLIKLIRLA